VKNWLFLSLLLASQLLAQSPADVPATHEEIQDLFTLMRVREQVGQVMEAIAIQQRAIIHDNLKRQTARLTRQDLARLDQFTIDIMKDLPIDDTVEDMIPIYQRHLTKSDVEAMTTFYSSPTGQKLLREMPLMTIESMQAASPRIQALMDKVMEHAAQMADDAKRKSATPKPPADHQ
jgi:glutamyl/glutaminyl-tRNA synthetase